MCTGHLAGSSTRIQEDTAKSSTHRCCSFCCCCRSSQLAWQLAQCLQMSTTQHHSHSLVHNTTYRSGKLLHWCSPPQQRSGRSHSSVHHSSLLVRAHTTQGTVLGTESHCECARLVRTRLTTMTTGPQSLPRWGSWLAGSSHLHNTNMNPPQAYRQHSAVLQWMQAGSASYSVSTDCEHDT